MHCSVVPLHLLHQEQHRVGIWTTPPFRQLQGGGEEVDLKGNDRKKCGERDEEEKKKKKKVEGE